MRMLQVDHIHSKVRRCNLRMKTQNCTVNAHHLCLMNQCRFRCTRPAICERRTTMRMQRWNHILAIKVRKCNLRMQTRELTPIPGHKWMFAKCIRNCKSPSICKRKTIQCEGDMFVVAEFTVTAEGAELMFPEDALAEMESLQILQGGRAITLNPQMSDVPNITINMRTENNWTTSGTVAIIKAIMMKIYMRTRSNLSVLATFAIIQKITNMVSTIALDILEIDAHFRKTGFGKAMCNMSRRTIGSITTVRPRR